MLRSASRRATFPALSKQHEYSLSVCSAPSTWPIYLSCDPNCVCVRGMVLACCSTSLFVMCDIMLAFMSKALLRCLACQASGLLSIVGVMHEYSSPYKIVGLKICLNKLSFICCGILLCFQKVVVY